MKQVYFEQLHGALVAVDVLYRYKIEGLSSYEYHCRVTTGKGVYVRGDLLESSGNHLVNKSSNKGMFVMVVQADLSSVPGKLEYEISETNTRPLGGVKDET